MDCLVTGAAGFVGSHLCELLLRKGHRVLALDNFSATYPRPVKEANLRACVAHPRFSLIEGDAACDIEAWMSLGIETVFHLAADDSADPAKDPSAGNGRVHGSLRLIEAAKRMPLLHRIVLASSASVYGRNAAGDETTICQPSTPEGVMHLAAEQFFRLAATRDDLPIVTVRLFGVYGPRQRPDQAISRWLSAAFTGRPAPRTSSSHALRAPLYVTDAARALLTAADCPSGEVYNVGGAEPVSADELFRRVQGRLGRVIPTRVVQDRPGEALQALPDGGKFAKHTSWKPEMSLEEGLEKQAIAHRAAMSQSVAA